jgi:hypothetical protein
MNQFADRPEFSRRNFLTDLYLQSPVVLKQVPEVMSFLGHEQL